jgi:hypothetical protein
VDVWVGFVLLAFGVVSYVAELCIEVFGVADAVFVIAGVPDFAEGLIADGEGVSAFDELDAAGCGMVDGWSDEDVDVVGHDGEAVKKEAAFVSVLEEAGDEEFGVGCALEVAVSPEGQDGDGVGALLLTDGGHMEESIPQGLKPLFFLGVGRAKPEGLAYLEACSRFARMIPHLAKSRQIWGTRLCGGPVRCGAPG